MICRAVRQLSEAARWSPLVTRMEEASFAALRIEAGPVIARAAGIMGTRSAGFGAVAPGRVTAVMRCSVQAPGTARTS